jgi:hypothetical protein
MKEIIKINAEINEMKAKWTMQTVNEIVESLK